MTKKKIAQPTCASCAWAYRVEATASGRHICGLLPPTVVATHDNIHSAQPLVADCQPWCQHGRLRAR